MECIKQAGRRTHIRRRAFSPLLTLFDLAVIMYQTRVGAVCAQQPNRPGTLLMMACAPPARFNYLWINIVICGARKQSGNASRRRLRSFSSTAGRNCGSCGVYSCSRIFLVMTHAWMRTVGTFSAHADLFLVSLNGENNIYHHYEIKYSAKIKPVEKVSGIAV